MGFAAACLHRFGERFAVSKRHRFLMASADLQYTQPVMAHCEFARAS